MSSSQLKLRDVSDVTEDTGLDGLAGYVSQPVLQLRAVLLATLIVRGVALPHLLRQTVDGLEGVHCTLYCTVLYCTVLTWKV